MDILTALDSKILAEENRREPRDYIGLSMSGNECDRFIWYTFHRPLRNIYTARQLRIFKRGHFEEARIIEDLKAAGFIIEREQEQVRYNDLVRGHIDGVIYLGEEPHLLEIKTHGDKYWQQVNKNGVYSNRSHYAQMQAYMHGLGLKKGCYYALNKNTDQIYIEIIDYDEWAGDAIEARMIDISKTTEPPLKLSDNPTWYKCKMCDYWSKCHGVR